MMGKIRAGMKGKETEAKEFLQKFIELAPQHPDASTAKKMLKQLGG
jgi:Mn-containing catalase